MTHTTSTTADGWTVLTFPADHTGTCIVRAIKGSVVINREKMTPAMVATFNPAEEHRFGLEKARAACKLPTK